MNIGNKIDDKSFIPQVVHLDNDVLDELHPIDRNLNHISLSNDSTNEVSVNDYNVTTTDSCRKNNVMCNNSTLTSCMNNNVAATVDQNEHNLTTGSNSNNIDKKKYSSIRKLQSSINSASSLLENWNSEFKFDVMLFRIDNHKNYNIFKYLENEYKLHPPQIYFCKKKYPCKDGFSDLGWSSLLKDLQRCSLCQGFSIASCGYGNQKNIFCNIKCSHGFLYQSDIKKRKVISNYRITSPINDRKNSRGIDGKKLPRRSSTKRALKKKSMLSMLFSYIL